MKHWIKNGTYDLQEWSNVKFLKNHEMYFYNEFKLELTKLQKEKSMGLYTVIYIVIINTSYFKYSIIIPMTSINTLFKGFSIEEADLLC